MPLVLCYHAVSDDWDHPLAVRRDSLRRHVRAALRLGWKPATAADVVAGRSRAMHVTFDDAYRSVLDVLPLDVPATVFACADYAAEGRRLELPPLDAVPAQHKHELETLSWDGLRELAERGVEIGAHSRTHPDLRTTSDHELQEEVATSREELETELGRPCRYFAYPYGQFDERVRQAVERAGYEAAFGLLGVGRTRGRFAIPRIEPAPGDGAPTLLLKGSPAWPLVFPALRKARSALAHLT
jgi:peptidoglycan/xylan/chitin deacetylase (PgdA/CDA1 family)